MAHECILCSGECYCSGDIDDCIVSLTPARCETCGCAGEMDDWRDDDWDNEDGDRVSGMGTYCPCCNRPYDEIDYEYQICHVCKHEHKSQAQTCRSCGCHDQMACTHPDHGACWWAEAAQINPDGSGFVGPLCSHCAMKLEHVSRPWQDKNSPIS